ncbi:hypothetical protein [Cellulomonas sp.]|uniref:hypothetical protein n=1 Tax=Cellulomonas sp. TaxID=40001 RepID=UPI002810D1EF|nr:hypothetical protein [Cellulomonas sp.]
MVAPPTPAVEDPTLTSLVPRPSRWRDALLVVLALTALVAAGWLGTASRLDLRGQSGAGELLRDGRVVQAVEVKGWVVPGTRVVSADAPAGTRVAGVWVLGADEPDPFVEVAGLHDALEARQAADDPGTLPRAVPSAGLRLLVLLDVEDCALLADDAPAARDHDGAVEVRSPLGSTHRVHLAAFTWPREDLEAAGACD